MDFRRKCYTRVKPSLVSTRLSSSDLSEPPESTLKTKATPSLSLKKTAETRVSLSDKSEPPESTFRTRARPSLSLKKTASTSEFGSSENYNIETPISSNENALKKTPKYIDSLKRPLEKCGPVIYDKKLKLNEKYSADTESSEEVLEDTLDNFDVSTIFINNASKTSPEVLNKTEYDAFANFLNSETTKSTEPQKRDDDKVQKHDTPSNLQPNDDIDDDLFSQSFNTQVINQINMLTTAEHNKSSRIESEDEHEKEQTVDKLHESNDNKIPSLNPFPDKISANENNKSIIESEDEKENCQKTDNTKLHDSENDIFKLPILKSFKENLLAIKAKKDKQLNDRTMLFNDESVTTQYKKEVDTLFEKIEQSICAMGMDDIKKSIPDKILDVIFSDDAGPSKDNNNVKLPEDLSKSLANIDWEPSCSFGTVIKEALRRNACKNVQPHKEKTNLNSSLNVSLSDKEPVFRSLGSFYGLPDKVKDLIKLYKGIDKLYDWQAECLDLTIPNRKNLVYALPTSGGKTLVAEILMLKEVLCRQKNAIFILPYVSIVQEKVWDLSPFGIALDFLVEEYASSKGTYPPRKRRRKQTVYIATIEKALGLVNSLIETGRLNEIGLIVVDELHLIGEEGRGATLEACLTKILFLKANIQIVGMSATIGNVEEICQFLNAEIYTKNFRPVELTEYVKCTNEIARINWTSKTESDLLVDVKKLDYKYSEAVSKLDPDMLGGLALEVIPKGSCLVFCPSKKNCENVVYLLCKLAKPNLKNYKKFEKEQLLEGLKAEAGELCDILKFSVPFGLAYHHSGLTNDERRLLEDAFRAGTISVICCTSTLAAGVNLPARRVILRSPYIGKDFINLSRYKQMAGRAGRAGLGEMGESIIITQPVDLPKVKQLLMSPMNQALSNLHEMEGKGLRHLLLSCISLGIANTRSQLQNVARSTLMAVQVDKLKIDVKKLTDNVIKKLFKLGALRENSEKSGSSSVCDVSVKMDASLAYLTNSELDSTIGGASTSSKRPKKTIVLTSNTKLVVSNLGSAAIKGGLDLCRAHQLYEDLYEAQKSLVLLNCLHLLYLVTPYETSEHIRPNMQVYYEVLTHLGEKELQTAAILGFDEAVITKMAAGQAAKQIPEKILNRFYVTLMLYDLWNEMPVFKVSEKYQINRGIVQNLMTSSASFASNVVNFCEQLEEFWAFSHLLKGMSLRLSHCCVRELAPLMELPAVKQSRAKQLYTAGYKNLQSIAKANVNDLVDNIEFMTRRTACQLVAAAKMLLLEKVENLREEAEDVLDGVENPQLLNMSVGPFRS